MSQSIALKNLNEILKNVFPKISEATKNYYDILYNISTTIFEKRIELDMSQKDLAKFLGVSQAMISKYESGDYNFTIETLCKISEKLELQPSFSFVAHRFELPEFDCISGVPVEILPELPEIEEAA